MSKRRYRRNHPMAGGLLSDAAYIANRFSWHGAVILGVVQFVVFYWLLLEWVYHQLDRYGERQVGFLSRLLARWLD